MGKQLSAREFISSLGKSYFHGIRQQTTGINLANLSTDSNAGESLGCIMGLESMNYASALETFVGKMPDEKGEFLLSQLITKMQMAYSLREIGGKQICGAIDRIYETYSNLEKYFKEPD